MYLKILIILFITIPAYATTYYLSPSGNDSYTTEQAQIESTPWLTFSKAFGEMSATDELILLDGTYSIANSTGCISNSGTGCAQPPSGSSTSAMTIVRAQNEGAVYIDGANAGTGAAAGYAVFIGASIRVDSYIKIQGVIAYGGIGIYNGDYCYIKNCGSRGLLGIGSSDHSDSCDYNLIEDCFAWSEDERILCSMYEGRYNIFRRVVIRGDGCDEVGCAGSGNPNVGLTVYSSQNCLVQNVIIVDRILNGGYPYADFATAQHSGGANDYALTGNQWVGCISIGTEDSGFYFEGDTQSTPSHYVNNCLVLNPTTAGFNITSPEDPTIENCSVFNTGDEISTMFRYGDGTDGQITRNIIGYGAADRGITRGGTCTYADTYGPFSIERYNTTTVSTGELTTDPTDDGSPVSSLYPVRVESDSALSGTGYGSSDYGATILKKWGTTGAFYGDTGYNTITEDDLWPFPNEDVMKTEMSKNYSDSDEARGFCAEGQTLTKYIWEYLGNTMPAGLYNNASIGSGATCKLGSGATVQIQ